MGGGGVNGTIIHTATLAKALGPEYDTQRARRLLQRTGAGVKVGGRVVTTPRLVADHMPELWNELMLRIDDERYL